MIAASHAWLAWWVVAALWTLLAGLRLALALHYLLRARRSEGLVREEDAERVTVLQPILAGDPCLERNLEENLLHHPEAHFVWLVDEDDAEARRIAELLRTRHAERPGGLEILRCPPPPQGRNPKVFKLVRGLEHAHERVAVLDDDTVLPAGGLARASHALAHGALVTGLPCYRAEGSFWSRLLAAFVNGNALLTYLPILAFRSPVTINGMFYLTARSRLEALGGFAAIEDKLCDDFELAKLYRRAGLPIVQTTIAHPVATTVRGPAEYARILRRWMVFANQLFRESIDPLMMVLVVLPALLPAAWLVAAVPAGPMAIGGTLGALFAKGVLMAFVRRGWSGRAEAVSAPLLEVPADLLQPLHAAAALVRPSRIRWRSRSIETRAGDVHYR